MTFIMCSFTLYKKTFTITVTSDVFSKSDNSGIEQNFTTVIPTLTVTNTTKILLVLGSLMYTTQAACQLI